jgi:hypothetical protein
MDTKLEIRNNYIFLKLTGQFDINRIKEIICEVGEQLHRHNLKKVFSDVTEVIGVDVNKISIMTVFDISILMTKTHPTGTKISFLGTKEQMFERDFFENLLANRGFYLKVTTDPEECFKWLGVSSEEKP